MIGIYVRLSKEDDESNSIENQLREGRAFANGKPFKVYNEGQGISGKADIEKRPQFFKLLDDIENGTIKKVWARNQNRVERNRYTFAKFLKLLIENKVRLFYADKEYDLKDPSVKLQLGILSDINEYIADNQSYQTKKSLYDNAKEGKAFGITPYGYQKDERGYFEVNETEAYAVRKIYELSLSGKGTRTIAEILNEEGVPTRYNTIGKGTISVKNKYTKKVTTKEKTAVKWAGNTVRGIITNTLYKGERKWRDELFKIPAIFDSNYWQKVNDNLKNNANNRGKSVEHKYMLKGILECFECGRNYYGRTRTNKKDNFYMCSSKRYKNSTCTNKSINIDVIESFVWESMFEGNTIYEKMVKTFQDGGTVKRRTELKKNIESYKKNLADLKEEHKRIIRALVKGTITDEDVKDEKVRITRSQNDNDERLKKASEELYELENEARILEDINIDFGNLDHSLFEKNPKLKQKLIDAKTQRQRKRKFNPNWNDKRKLIQKYIKRILIEFDHDNLVFTFTIKYNLPIEDETYLMDSNYIYAYRPQNDEFLKWFNENGRHYTPEMVSKTYYKLREYYS